MSCIICNIPFIFYSKYRYCPKCKRVWMILDYNTRVGLNGKVLEIRWDELIELKHGWREKAIREMIKNKVIK